MEKDPSLISTDIIFLKKKFIYLFSPMYGKGALRLRSGHGLDAKGLMPQAQRS
jgi:hypothetical protein